MSYFEALGRAFKPVGSLFSSANPSRITEKHRGPHGGHVLFRPIGLDIFTRTATEFAKVRCIELNRAVAQLNVVPTDLAKPPYCHVIWDPARQRVNGRAKGIARDLLRHIVGLPADDSLLERYRVALDDPSRQLPQRVL